MLSITNDLHIEIYFNVACNKGLTNTIMYQCCMLQMAYAYNHVLMLPLTKGVYTYNYASMLPTAKGLGIQSCVNASCNKGLTHAIMF